MSNAIYDADLDSHVATTTRRVKCDGLGQGRDPALGHPRVWLEIDERGYVDCGYCDRRFILIDDGDAH